MAMRMPVSTAATISLRIVGRTCLASSSAVPYHWLRVWHETSVWSKSSASSLIPRAIMASVISRNGSFSPTSTILFERMRNTTLRPAVPGASKHEARR